MYSSKQKTSSWMSELGYQIGGRRSINQIKMIVTTLQSQDIKRDWVWLSPPSTDGPATVTLHASSSISCWDVCCSLIFFKLEPLLNLQSGPVPGFFALRIWAASNLVPSTDYNWTIWMKESCDLGKRCIPSWSNNIRIWILHLHQIASHLCYP